MMLTETPLVSREEVQTIRRARSRTLLLWYQALNNSTDESLAAKFPEIISDDRRIQLMDQINCELGDRFMKDLRKETR